MITYPSDWRLASDKPGMVILAGPRALWERPAATIVITHGEETSLRQLLAAAVRGVGTGQPLHLLGEQRIGPDRLARYFTRGDGFTAQYIVVGAATRQGLTITIIGMDMLRDPMLQFNGGALQRLLLDLTLP